MKTFLLLASLVMFSFAAGFYLAAFTVESLVFVECTTRGRATFDGWAHKVPIIFKCSRAL